MLRGNATATMDDKGRFKLPSSSAPTSKRPGAVTSTSRVLKVNRSRFIPFLSGKKSKKDSPSFLPKILRRRSFLIVRIITVN